MLARHFNLIADNIIKGLYDSGHNDIIVVDNLKNGKKFQNLKPFRRE
jgi:ADP-L-glycero-D-manno-heptose 6-epimerase